MTACSDLRILFAGNPDIAVPALEALASTYRVVGVLANPDKPAGRGRHLEPPAVKTASERLGIPVLQYDKLRTEARNAVAKLQPNMLISFACGHFFGPKFLSLFPSGAINIHPSLLPKYRGSSPLQFAILNGESETGISVQRIVDEIDAGDILARMKLPLDGTETTQSLGNTVSQKAGELIVATIRDLCNGTLEERPQVHDDATFSRMLNKEDGLIDWNRTVREIHCMVRAFQPWPRAYTSFCKVPLFITGVYGSHFEAPFEPLPEQVVPGTVVKRVKKKGLVIACADGLLYVDRLQLAKKKEMDSAAFTNGNATIIGSVLGTDDES